MTTTLTRDEVYQRVEEVLVEALCVEPEEVAADKALTGDLGAESIDFLDIVFRLEKSFDIKIGKGELFPDDILNDPGNVDKGKMTSEGLERLMASMPHADFTEFKKDPNVSKVPDLFTVNTIVNYVTTKVNGV